MDDLEKLYRIRFTDTDRAKKDQVWRVLCEHFFQGYVSPTDTLLDIGCGYGEFSRHTLMLFPKPCRVVNEAVKQPNC